jgi:hypothetical protein
MPVWGDPLTQELTLKYPLKVETGWFTIPPGYRSSHDPKD